MLILGRQFTSRAFCDPLPRSMSAVTNIKGPFTTLNFLVRLLNAFIWNISTFSSPPIGEISGSELRFPARIELKEASYLSSKDAYLSTEEIYAFSIPMNFFYSFELLLEF